MGVGQRNRCLGRKYVINMQTHLQNRMNAKFNQSVLIFVFFSSSDPSVERISENLLFQMFETTAPVCNDNDKVRTNAARILGNLLRLISASQILIEKWQTVCINAIQKLCDQAKLTGTNFNMKVKWNACYAIGNFMKNTVIYDLQVNHFCWQVKQKKKKFHV